VAEQGRGAVSPRELLVRKEKRPLRGTVDGEGAKEASQPSPRSTLVWPRKESRKEERRRERNASSSEWTSSSEFRSRRMGDSEEERKAVN
jgi:hypothetical protein